MGYHPGRMDYVAVAGVIVALVAGAIGIPVAIKQLRLGRDLERAKVYDAIKKYLNAVSQLGHAPNEVLREFHDATEDTRVRVLFAKEDARAYIVLLRTKANDLRTLGALKESVPSVREKWLDLVQWMEQQRSSELEKRFGKYL